MGRALSGQQQELCTQTPDRIPEVRLLLSSGMTSGKLFHVFVQNFLICKMGSLLFSEGYWKDKVR